MKISSPDVLKLKVTFFRKTVTVDGNGTTPF